MATKILMVCLGNICRSPLAQGILENKVNPKVVQVDSAGTGGYHIGSPPDERSIAVGLKYGVDISNQRCRKFTPEDFKCFTRIYVMDKSNYNDIIALANNQNDIEKVQLLLSESNQDNEEVPDPYYGGKDGFENVFQMIDKACEHIATKLKNGEIN